MSRLWGRTCYEYSLTAMGIKEDIVVAAYTGQTEYSFTLQTGGLTAVNQYGTWVLVDEDNTVCASLSDVIVFTADERNNTFGELRVEEITAGQTYRLTVVLDADWLADPKTVYPITIDPSVTYNTTGAIEDLVVGTSTTYNGYSGSLYVGRGASGAKIRTLMRFPNLQTEILGYNVTYAQIVIRDLICESTAQTVQCYEYAGVAWAESKSIEWTEMGNTPLGEWLDEESVHYSGGNDEIIENIHRFAFDITDLAQMWASGDADPALGIIFKATDDYEVNGTKTFKTFASINRGSNPPTLTINYTPTVSITASSTTINEGSTLSLSASVYPSDTSVTWSTSNSSIATVSSTGVVTGVHAGSVNITATAADGDSDTISLIVTIPNGFYYIQNAYSKLYLSTSLSGKAHTNVFQNGIVNTTPGNLTSIWRFNYLGNNRYSIRPLSKLDMGLTHTDGNVDICDIGISDDISDVMVSARWEIQYNSRGYIFKNAGSSEKTLALSLNSSEIGANVHTETYSEMITRHHWAVTEVSSAIPTGVILYDTYITTSTGLFETEATNYIRYLSSGDVIPINSLGLEASVYSNDYDIKKVSWSSSNPDIVSVSYPMIGILHANSPGTSTITATATINGTNYTVSFKVVVADIATGTYYVRNRQHDKYLQINNTYDANSTNADNFNIEQWAFNRGLQKWKLELSYDGYYTITSVTTGRVLSVPEGCEYEEDVTLIQETYISGNSRQQWKIVLTSNGTFKIKARSAINFSTDLVMVAGNMVDGEDNGIVVQQRKYVDNNSYKDEWEIIGSIVSYVNYYDSSIESDETSMSYIQSVNSFVNTAYSNALGVQFKMDGLAEPSPDTYLAQCPNDIHSQCSTDCGSEHIDHHKSIERISDYMYSESRESNHIYALWTNRSPYTYCFISSDAKHCVVDATAVVVNNRPVIHVMNLDFENGDLQACMALTLAHETAHTFGMPEVYGSTHDQINGYGCVMEDEESIYAKTYYDNVLLGTSNIFCDSCQSTMLGLIYNNMQLGNEN